MYYTKIDELGRITLPEKCRQVLDLKENDEVEISLDIIEMRIRKPIFGCVFCNAAVNLVRIGDICACRRCIEKLHKAKDGDYLYPMRVD